MWDKYRCVNSQCNRMFVPKYCSSCENKDYQLCPTCHDNEHWLKFIAVKFGVEYRPLKDISKHARQH